MTSYVTVDVDSRGGSTLEAATLDIDGVRIDRI